MIEVKQYTQKKAQEWNDFIEQSRQGTFLFNRSYMDYHADRFQDASLMIYRKEQLYALLPANRSLMTFGKDRRRGVRKATRAGVTVRESKDLATFWDILDKNLTNKYATHPVHSLEELTLLHSRFPNSIRLFMAYNDKGIAIGGTIIYDMPQVVHTQYISASPEGKRLGAIDLLFDYILNDVYANHKGFFDFGKSTEEEGKILNTTLIFQKEGFGGRGVCYDCYTWETRSVIE